MANTTADLAGILANSTYPDDIKAACANEIIAQHLNPPFDTTCNWRISIARDCSLFCVKNHDIYYRITLSALILDLLVALICAAQLAYRRRYLNKTFILNGEIQPIEFFFIFQFLYNFGRFIHQVLVISDTFPSVPNSSGIIPMLTQGEVSFEFVFPIAYASLVAYAMALARTLLKVKTSGFYSFLRKPWMLEMVTGLYIAFVFILQVGLAGYSGEFNVWTSENSDGTISWAGHLAYKSAVFIRLSIWEIHCVFLIVLTTTILFLFVKDAERAARRSKSKNQAVIDAIRKMKISVLLLDLVLLLFIIVNTLSMTQVFYAHNDDNVTTWLCAIFNYMPKILVLIANGVFAYNRQPTSSFSTMDSSDRTASEAATVPRSVLDKVRNADSMAMSDSKSIRISTMSASTAANEPLNP